MSALIIHLIYFQLSYTQEYSIYMCVISYIIIFWEPLSYNQYSMYWIFHLFENYRWKE